MKIAIVIPIFNEEIRILNVLKDLSKTLFPIIIIDDHSNDRTYKIISDFIKFKKSKITLLQHKVNLGKGAALKTACQVAFNKGFDALVLMDGDGQHKVSDLSRFIEKIKEGNEIVFGSRNWQLGVPLIRFMGNKIASILVSMLFGIYVSDLLCGYRAITKKAFKKINWVSSGYGVETEMVIKAAENKLKSCEVPVETIYYDRSKGVTVLDAIWILIDVISWRIRI